MALDPGLHRRWRRRWPSRRQKTGPTRRRTPAAAGLDCAQALEATELQPVVGPALPATWRRGDPAAASEVPGPAGPPRSDSRLAPEEADRRQVAVPRPIAGARDLHPQTGRALVLTAWPRDLADIQAGARLIFLQPVPQQPQAWDATQVGQLPLALDLARVAKSHTEAQADRLALRLRQNLLPEACLGAALAHQAVTQLQVAWLAEDPGSKLGSSRSVVLHQVLRSIRTPATIFVVVVEALRRLC